MRRLWRGFRGWPLWSQIVIGFTGLGLVLVPVAPKAAAPPDPVAAVVATTQRPSERLVELTLPPTTFESTTSTAPAPPPTTTAPPAPTPTAPATTTAGPAPATAPPAAAKPEAGHCSATVDNARPAQYSTVTVTVVSNVADLSLTATAHYKSTNTTNTSMTGGDGTGVVDFRISRATIGYEVKVDVDISGRAACSTSFTPT